VGIIVLYFIYVSRFIGHEAVPVPTEACLINEEVGNLLGVQDGFPRLVDEALALVVEGELDLIYAVGDAEPRVHNALHDGHHLVVRRLLVGVVKGGHRHEDLTERLLPEHEVFHGEAEGQVAVEGHLVEDAVQLLLRVLIEDVGVLWLVSQVQLQMASWLHTLQLLIIIHLTFNHRKHSVANTHNREMLIMHLVMRLRPPENLLDGLCEGVVAVGDECLRVTRNVQSI